MEWNQQQSRTSRHGGGIISHVMKCKNCGNYMFAILQPVTADGSVIRYMTAPNPKPHVNTLSISPDLHFPEDVAKAYIQAKKSLVTESWDAAATMARRSVQAAVKLLGAKGHLLHEQIADVVKQGLLVKAMGDWATEVRYLGNQGAHPDDDTGNVSAAEAKEVVKFAYQLAYYLFTIPADVEKVRSKRVATTPPKQKAGKGKAAGSTEPPTS